MSLTRDDLQAISDIMQIQLEPLKKQVGNLETQMGSLDIRVGSLETRVDSLETRMDNVEKSCVKTNLLLENIVIPRLQNIEDCYVSTFKRYQEKADQIDAMQEDVNLLKKVVADHSERLLKLA